MYIETKELMFPKSGEIVVRYEVDPALHHPISVWVNETKLIIALSESEAQELCEKLGFALQDFKRASE